MASSIARDRIKSVAFKIRSRDQGWADAGGHGTYNNSHTWFEASILKRVEQSDHQLPLEDSNGMPLTFGSVMNARESLLRYGWDFKFVDGDKCVWKVHNNVTAERRFREHNVRWVKGEKTLVWIGMGSGKGFVENLQPGDLIVLWARAEVSYLPVIHCRSDEWIS